MTDKRFCVYAHVIDGVIKYIGEGTIQRAFRKSRKGHDNWNKTFIGIDFDVVILKDNLSKEEASVLELQYIEEHRTTIINKKTASCRPVEINYGDISEILYYDETSPTCLRWKNNRGTKIKAGDVAGYILKSTGYINIEINDRQYRGHRIVWLLVNGSIPTDREIDHISGDSSDNRISNLRLVSRKENTVNRILPPPSTGLRNIRECVGKTGLYGFEVVWATDDKRRQKTFSIKEFGSAELALTSAYVFRDTLIQKGFLTERLKTGEDMLDQYLVKYSGIEVATKCVRVLPKSGIRMLDFDFYKGKLSRFLVRYYSNEGKLTSKSFPIKVDGIHLALTKAYDFRESLINDGLLSERLKYNEATFEDVLQAVESYQIKLLKG